MFIMMTVTWLALWAASKSGDHRPPATSSRIG
jgi:hypothetical protein